MRFLDEAGLLSVPLRNFGEAFRGTPVVDLEGADLRGADLANVSFSTSYATRDGFPDNGVGGTGVVLKGDLRGAKFDHATMDLVFFRDADLRGASLVEADLGLVSFSAGLRFGGTNIRDASFKGAWLSNVNFAGNRLDNAVFDDAVVILTNFPYTCLHNASFVAASFGNSWNVLGQLSFIGAEGRAVDFSNAKNLSLLNVSDSIFTDVRLGGAEGQPKGWGLTETRDPDAPRSAFSPCEVPRGQGRPRIG